MTVTLIQIDTNVQGDSTTSLSVGTGTKAFTLLSSQPFVKGMEVIAKHNDSNYLTGTVTTVVENNVVLDVTSSTGSGTYATWVLDGARTLNIGTSSHVAGVTEYRGDIVDPGNIEQYMFSVGTTFGVSKSTKGTIKVNNKDGYWDFVRKLGFAKGSIRIKQISNQKEAVPTVNVFAGTVIYAEVKFSEVVFSIADRLDDLGVQAQKELFLGTNVGSTGIEGSADGIKGQPKPFGLGGPILNAKPALVNEATRIYALNFDYDGTTSSITTLGDLDVLDKGLGKSLDTTVGTSGDFANLAALQAATIASGKFVTCKAEGLFRLAGAPAGEVTANFTQSSLTGAAIVKNLIERIGFTTSDYVNSTFTDVDSDNSSSQELYVEDSSTVQKLAVEIMSGIGGYLISDTDNKLRVGIFKSPDSGTSVKTFKQDSVIDLSTFKSKDSGQGVPPKQIKLNYKKNYKVIADNNFAGSVIGTSDQLLYNTKYRELASVENEAVSRKHPNAPIFEIDTHFVNETDTQTELTRQENLRQIDRQFFEFSTYDLTPLNLGDIVTLQIDGRFDLSSGKKTVILGKEINLRKSKIKYIVLG